MPDNEQTRNESELQKQAFEYYYALGSRRRYASVARKYEVSVSTIKNWSRWFGWRQRVEEREIQTTKVMAEKAQAKMADELEREAKLLDLIESKGAKDLVEGRARVSAKDVLKAIEIKRSRREKMQEEAEAEGKSASAQNVLVMLDNGRGDCTLPHESIDQSKEDEEKMTENKQPEEDDNGARQTGTS